MSTIGILGIDAAWTSTEPSGVALLAASPSGLRLVAASSSYDEYCRPTDRGTSHVRPRGSAISARDLLRRSEAAAGTLVSLVAVDMPVARSPIVGRRVSDREISRAFGGMGCSTHSPNAIRPGKLSSDVLSQFTELGLELATGPVSPPCLIEVYPHPALLALTGSAYRVPYKLSRARRYWPQASTTARRQNLLQEWHRIIEALDARIAGVADLVLLPDERSPGYAYKAAEDMIDAVICAWTGACVLNGRAQRYGDEESSIWVPLGD